MRFGNLILLLKLVDNMCPSRWLVGMNGLLKEIAKDLENVNSTLEDINHTIDGNTLINYILFLYLVLIKFLCRVKMI